MSGSTFPTKRLGEVLKYVRRPITPEFDKSYDLIGVRWYAAGTHLHATIEGSKLKAPTLWKVKEGDVIYNKMWASKGAFAVVSKETSILFGTSEYPTFEPSANACPDFLRLAFHSERFWKRAEAWTNGTTERARLNPRDFLRLRLALPPLAEQRAIAEVLGAVEDTIAKTEALIDELTAQKTNLLNLFDAEVTPARKMKLRNLVKSLTAGVSVGGEVRYRKQHEFGVLRTSSVSSGIFLPDHIKVISRSNIDRAATKPKADCIIIIRANTPEIVGTSTYVKNDHSNIFLSDKLWQIDVKDRNSVNVRWLSLVLGAPRMRRKISARANGTSSSMQNISKAAFLGLEILVPSIEIQNAIAAVVDTFETRQLLEKSYVDALNATRSILAQELLSGRLRLPENMIARHGDKPERAA